MNVNYKAVKEQALEEFGVVPMEQFNVKQAIRDRIDYLKNYLKSYNKKAIVLGISGGVDSSTAGKLSQMAISELRDEGYEAQFIAMRLPYKIQLDEDDAQKALSFINPDKTLTVNIESGVNGIFDSGISGCFEGGLSKDNTVVSNDFAKGNVKARMRMIAQYQVAGLYDGLVLGTDHNAEGFLSFYTKWGDGSCDFIVLNGLNKRQVRLCAKELGADEKIYAKPATADLEEEKPHLLDEDSTGIPYDVLDDFLEGKSVSKEMMVKMLDIHISTAHKRSLPVGFFKINLCRK